MTHIASTSTIISISNTTDLGLKCQLFPWVPDYHWVPDYYSRFKLKCPKIEPFISPSLASLPQIGSSPSFPLWVGKNVVFLDSFYFYLSFYWSSGKYCHLCLQIILLIWCFIFPTTTALLFSKIHSKYCSQHDSLKL